MHIVTAMKLLKRQPVDYVVIGKFVFLHRYRDMNFANDLTHCGLVTPYDIIKLGQYWFELW